MSLREKSASLSPNTPSSRRPHFETTMKSDSMNNNILPSDSNASAANTNGANNGAHLDRLQAAIEQIRDALRGLRYGSLTIQVQDGVVVQIDRTEKRRLQRPGSSLDSER